MEPLVLDSNFQITGVVDMFTSFIWTERYSAQGDFELELPIASGALSFINTDSYLYLPGSDRLMVIDTVKIVSDAETGTNILASGPSLESILNRRIVWGFYANNGNLQDIVSQLIDENAIVPSDPDRQITNLSYAWSNDPAVTEKDVEVSLFGEELYTAVTGICDSADLGFRITADPTPDVWNFGLYAGVDRSYSQIVNPYVVFSPGFENLLNSSYITSKKLLKTISLIGGEGDGADKRLAGVWPPEGALTDLNRREIYTDASGVSSNGGEIPEADYLQQLRQKGRENLASHVEFSIFDGEAQVGDMYEYGRDYNLGDIVQITNEYGFSSRSRVMEFIWTEDETGFKSYPTFAAL